MRRPMGAQQLRAPARLRKGAPVLVPDVPLTRGRAHTYVHCTRRRHLFQARLASASSKLARTDADMEGIGHPFEHLQLFRPEWPSEGALAKAVSARFHDEIYLVFIRFWSR